MTLPQEIQLFLIITTLIIAGINVAKGKVSDQQKYLSAFSIVTCIGMVGYYYEFCAVALSDAYCAITLEYFYFCFAPVFLLHFIILYSDSKLNRIFVRIFTVYEIATYIIIIHSKIITGPFFRAIYVVKSQGTSYISIVPGILYRINDIVNLIWSIWLVYLTFNGYIKHKKENRPELLLINIGSIIPCVGYISDMLGTCGHYPSSIIYNILAEIIFEFIVFHYNMFDTVEQAKNDYIHDMDEGVVVTNANDESVFHNPAVEKIFTDVDWTDNVEISEDAIDFMKKNRAGFASNDRFYNWHCSDLINNGRCEGYIYTIIDVTDDYEYTNQLMTLTVPGDLIIGADSHTCTYGAVGAFSTGVGSTDMAVGMATGKAWFKVPGAIKFNLTGKLPRFVSGKDVILHIIGMIGVDGALYKSMEFTGDGIKNLSMDDRFTIANMAIEAGGKNGIFPVDDLTREYLKEHSDRKYKEYTADPDAEYDETYDIDLSTLRPTVSFPHLPSNTRTFDQIKDPVRIDQVVIGSCTNGRMSDLRMAASIIGGHKVADGIRCIIIPATQAIYLKAMDEGLIKQFIEAGAVVSTPTCGPCLGGYMGVLAKGERCVSTTNRNFVGRMGDTESEVYLASPAVAAASALTGYITDPSKVL